jgi:hypothetical protein
MSVDEQVAAGVVGPAHPGLDGVVAPDPLDDAVVNPDELGACRALRVVGQVPDAEAAPVE